MSLKQYLQTLQTTRESSRSQSLEYFKLNDQSSEELEISHQHHCSRSFRALLLSVFLAISVLLNFILLYSLERSLSTPLSSTYAGLDRIIDVKIPRNNQSLEDDSWNDERYYSWAGMVALDESFVEKHKLPPAQEYPWDSTKMLYFIHGFHSMHCVKALRRAILETHQGRPWSMQYEHIAHCLNVLREDVLCYADDFPRYTGALNDQAGEKNPPSGLGSIRQCRDWDQLRAFVSDNSACYKPLPAMPSSVEQYKFCLDGNKPWEISGH